MDEAAPRKRRLFVGIALDEPARTACAAVSDELRATGFLAKYEGADKLHVTLAFLGFVEPSRLDAVVSVLGAAAKESPRLTVKLDKLGAFPQERRPRVVYVGARAQGAAFRALATNVRDRYAAQGFEFKNDALAHVTIARVKQSKRPLPLIDFAPILLEIESIALFESLPDPARKTSRYEIAAAAPLP